MVAELNTSQLILARATTERELSGWIVDLARKLGYLVHRDPTWRATATDAGYPDLTLIGHGRIVFAELKTEHGKLTDMQQDWRCEIGETKAEYFTWRPSHWFSGEIEAALR